MTEVARNPMTDPELVRYRREMRFVQNRNVSTAVRHAWPRLGTDHSGRHIVTDENGENPREVVPDMHKPGQPDYTIGGRLGEALVRDMLSRLPKKRRRRRRKPKEAS